jgi:nitroimidazol reductase NimA-like FMN-containing flavoprotein (pyridoxamine 5'-phosphate oxidase superfamily)
MTSTAEHLQANDRPTATNLAGLHELAPLDWDEVRRGLATNPTRQPRTFWLSTRDGNGRPHMTAVGAYWVDGRFYFCAGPRSRKIRNIERDPRCALGVAIEDYDVALEGRAERVTDEGHLAGLAQVFAEGGWAEPVAEGGFAHRCNATSAGPPPWHVYQFTPDDVYAVMTDEPGGATHWAF